MDQARLNSTMDIVESLWLLMESQQAILDKHQIPWRGEVLEYINKSANREVARRELQAFRDEIAPESLLKAHLETSQKQSLDALGHILENLQKRLAE